ncbi:MAG: PilZ domain-containing protein [Spirochaetaceae bacterium]|jgi:hypothetical protein|nr:PilZ domain-containing protein [Spirochaetaceae bacterium]
MGILTSQKISAYYDRYKDIEVTYSKEIIQVTNLVTAQVVLKCVGDFWPCVIYSSSFTGAKVVANVNSGLPQKLQQANNLASLRFCFKSGDSSTPVAFFVSAKVVGFSPYSGPSPGSQDMAIFRLQFLQRPPDDLIEIIGRLLDANINSAKRRDERILLTVESIRKLKILSKDSTIFIQGVPRRCILRDISFSGAKIIMMGVSKFLVNRDAALRVDFDDPRESFMLRGKFVRSEEVEGRKELIALALHLDDAQAPMGYKIRINDYLGQIRTEPVRQQQETRPAKAAPKPEEQPGTAASPDTASGTAKAPQ